MSTTSCPKCLQHQALINVPQQRVFDCLTDPRHLSKWLGDHVELDISAATLKVQGPHVSPDIRLERISQMDPPSRFGVTGYVKDSEMEALFLLAAQGSATMVTLENRILAGDDQVQVYRCQDFALVAISNLRHYCEAGGPMVWPEYPSNGTSMRAEVAIHASEAEVFAALTQPEVMKQWVANAPEVDLRVGGRYSYGWTEEEDGERAAVGPIEIVELETNKRLVHSWRYTGEADTLTEWIIERRAGDSILTVVQSGFGDATHLADYTQGWAAYLCRIKDLLEGRPAVSMSAH